MKIRRFIVATAGIAAFFSLSLSAQERNDVIAVYNEGAKAIQSDVPAAITAFEKVITLSRSGGRIGQ